MRNGLLGSVLAVLLGGGAAWSQPAGPCAVVSAAEPALLFDNVYAEEPLPVNDPLLDLHDHTDAGERVTLTPHNAWQSPWTWVRDSQELWLNVRRSLRGDPVQHLV